MKEVFQEMRSDPNVQLDLKAWTLYLTALVKAGQLNEIEPVLETMKEQKHKLGSSVFNSILITTYNGVEMVEVVVALMEKVGVKMDMSIYASLMKAWLQSERPNKVKEMFQQVRSAGFQLDANTWHTYLSALKMAGEFKEMEHAFAEMKQQGVMPTKITFHLMVQGYARERKPEGIQTMTEQMEKACLTMETRTAFHLIGAWRDVKRLDKVKEVLQRMRSVHNIQPDLKTWQIYLETLGREGEFEAMEQAFEEMKQQGVQPNRQILTSMAKAYKAFGRLDQAEATLALMKQAREGHQQQNEDVRGRASKDL